MREETFTRRGKRAGQASHVNLSLSVAVFCTHRTRPPPPCDPPHSYGWVRVEIVPDPLSNPLWHLQRQLEGDDVPRVPTDVPHETGDVHLAAVQQRSGAGIPPILVTGAAIGGTPGA